MLDFSGLSLMSVLQREHRAEDLYLDLFSTTTLVQPGPPRANDNAREAVVRHWRGRSTEFDSMGGAIFT